jgi:hypothetical protein
LRTTRSWRAFHRHHWHWNPNPETQLFFTYTCNSTVFAKQVANMSIYVPRVVTIKNPLVK